MRVKDSVSSDGEGESMDGRTAGEEIERERRRSGRVGRWERPSRSAQKGFGFF